MKRFLNCKQFAKAQNTVQYVYEIPTGKISVTTLDMETKCSEYFDYCENCTIADTILFLRIKC